MITEEEFLEAIYEQSHGFIEARGVPEKDIEGVLAAYRVYVKQRYAETYAKMEEKWDESVLASASKYAERAKSIDLRPLYEAADAARFEAQKAIEEPVIETPTVEETVAEEPVTEFVAEEPVLTAPEAVVSAAQDEEVQVAPAVDEQPVITESAPDSAVEGVAEPEPTFEIAFEEPVEAAQPVVEPIDEAQPVIEPLVASAPVPEPVFEPVPIVEPVEVPVAAPAAEAAFPAAPVVEAVPSTVEPLVEMPPEAAPVLAEVPVATPAVSVPAAAEVPAPAPEVAENPLVAEFPFAQPAVAASAAAVPTAPEVAAPVVEFESDVAPEMLQAEVDSVIASAEPQVSQADIFPDMPAMSEPAVAPAFVPQDYAPADPFATGNSAADEMFADAELPAFADAALPSFDDAELPAFDDALEDAFGDAFDEEDLEFRYQRSDLDGNGIDDAVDEALIVDAPVFPGRQPVVKTPEEEISDMSASAFELAKSVIDGAPVPLDSATCVSYCARLDELFAVVPADKADKIKTQVMESKFDYMTAAGQLDSLSVRTQTYAYRTMESAARMDALRSRVTSDVAHEVFVTISPLFAPEVHAELGQKLDHYYGVKVKRLFDQKIDEAHLAALPDVRRQLLDKEPPKFAGKDAAAVMAMLESV